MIDVLSIAVNRFQVKTIPDANQNEIKIHYQFFSVSESP